MTPSPAIARHLNHSHRTGETLRSYFGRFAGARHQVAEYLASQIVGVLPALIMKMMLLRIGRVMMAT
jgi:hypothetical protein